MVTPFLRRWAPLGIPLAALLVGLAFRLLGVLPGWATLLILGGIIGGGLVAYVILLGEHDRPMLTDRASEETKLAEFNMFGRSRGERGAGYDGR